ncbi:MAG: hypothetical protein J0L82_13695 [Deltaproteobacteria bacterium]|nr:hypothetical protein [Deltaproteobacteria bacterium]
MRFHKVTSLLLTVFLPVALFASSVSAEELQCYEKEIDYRTFKPFASSDLHASEKRDWDLVSRPQIGIIDLMHAYAVYKMEHTRAQALTSDKAKHCYIGCVVSLSTSAKVSDYLGWLKEDLDLSDCQADTLFEPADQVATSLGARLGARDKKECAIYCRDQFSKRR